jgi:hypothetical protein
MTKTRFVSVDYDDCLASKDRNAPYTNEEFIKRNQKLIDNLESEKLQYTETVVLIGSARQCKRMDEHDGNKKKNGYCRDYIPIFAKHINAKFDGMLMGDVYNKVPTGTTYSEAKTKKIEFGTKYKGCLLDRSKITILYAQIQKIALDYPEAQIDFKFYDDHPALLQGLQDFFMQNNHLIPSNITLELYRHTGEELEKKVSIPGTGESANPNYAKSVRTFAKNYFGRRVRSDDACFFCENPMDDLWPEWKKDCFHVDRKFDMNTSADPKLLVEAHELQINQLKPANIYTFDLNSKELETKAPFIFLAAGIVMLSVGCVGIFGTIAGLSLLGSIIMACTSAAPFFIAEVLGIHALTAEEDAKETKFKIH